MSLSQENRQIDRNNELIEYTFYKERMNQAEINLKSRMKQIEINLKSRYLRKMNLGEI